MRESDLSPLEARALAAYYRTPIPGNGVICQPGSVAEIEHAGLRYVVLANVNGILAVYRIRTVNGKDVLKGLKRWPTDLSAH